MVVRSYSLFAILPAGMGISVVPASMQRLHLDAVVYRPLSGPHRPNGQLNLAVRDDALASSATAFLAMVRKDAGATRNT